MISTEEPDKGIRYIFIICLQILAYKIRSDNNIENFKLGNLTHALELYADDCSIFLKPKDLSLRTAISTLDNFYRLSGLKISVSKTKAIWFGSGATNQYHICPDLTLDWDNKFKLLGIDFHNNLVGMECNHESKVREMKRIFNNWTNRTMMVYGRAVVIKTLTLPKLTLATVLQNLDKRQMKELENIKFSFLWANKPDKVCREDAKTT